MKEVKKEYKFSIFMDYKWSLFYPLHLLLHLLFFTLILLPFDYFMIQLIIVLLIIFLFSTGLLHYTPTIKNTS